MSLIIPEVGGPAIIVTQSTGLSSDGEITIPPNCYPLQLIVKNSGSATSAVSFTANSELIAGLTPPIGGIAFNGIAKLISDSETTVYVTATDWTNMTLDVSIVLVRVA
jgi:hypothetical protein